MADYHWTLSEILADLFDFQGRVYRISGIGFESANNVGPTQSYGQRERECITRALTQLSLEMRGAKPKKVRYAASTDGITATIEMMHDGKAIPAEELAELNSRLEQITSGEKEHIGMRHGNLIAARELKPIGGRLYLSSADSEGYAVKTTVELPMMI